MFRALMKGVRPVQQNRADPGKPRKKSDASLQLRREAAGNEPVGLTGVGLSDGKVQPVNPSDSLEFHLPDLPLRTLQQLKKGQLEWQEGLDLHGYTIEAARAALSDFIRDGRARGYRCLLLVHGKSWNREDEVPSIKSHVNAWLRQMPDVLAFCSALPTDGGTGAVYILLRTRSTPKDQ
nr:Smr/MutS family protein [Marinospirillum alkaliphilum]